MNSTITEARLAVKSYVDAVSRLRELRIVRSRNTISDFSEWLAVQTLGGALAERRNQAGWDIHTQEDEKIQVKYAFLPDDSSNRWSPVNNPDQFDILVLFVFGDDLKVREFYKVPNTSVRQKIRTDSQGFHIYWSDIANFRQSGLQLPQIEDLSEFFDLDGRQPPNA